MSRVFTSSVAAAALIAVLSGPVLAQSEPAAPAAPATEAPTVTVPQVLQDAGLTDVESKPTRRGSRIEGSLPDGTEIGAILDDKGGLRGLRADGDGALPQALIDQLVPQAVRNQAIFAELGRIEAIFTGERGVMVAGKDAQDKPVRAAFAEDGTLLRFGRGDEAGRGMGPMGDHGPKGHGKHDDKGPKGRDRDHTRGDRHGDDDRKEPKRDGFRDGARDGGRDAGRDGDGARGPQGQPQTVDQIRASLTQAGYTGIGQVLQQGPVTVAQATNPEGEPVLVEVGVDGSVLRELNR